MTVYERDEGPGGLMRFGVPDAKLEKWIIDRRVDILEQEGIEFVYDVDVGPRRLRRASCATATTRSSSSIGSRVQRDLDGPGPRARGHPLRDGLPVPAQPLRGRRSEGRPRRVPAPGTEITAAGKRVVVVGGGDTGMDCISNANREGARERRTCSTSTPTLPPTAPTPDTPWPLPPKRTRTTYALDEGGKRRWGTPR